MKTIKQLTQPFKRAGAGALLLFALLLSFLVEAIFFNSAFFSRFTGSAPRTELDLSTQEGYNGEALPLLPENPTVSFDGLSLPVKNVVIHTSGSWEAVSGTVGICDEASAYRTQAAGTFQVNPGGRQSTALVPLSSHGSLSRLRITLTSETTEPVFLLSVVVNERVPFSIHPLRFLLVAGFLFVLFCSLRFSWHTLDYQPDKKSHRLMNLCVLAFCLLISGLILYGGSPTHAYLKPYPTLEEVRSPEMIVDAYMQQLDAFEKGQIALDLDVNPELHALDNPYDKGERDKKEISYHWDRAYYNGKYYSYFGLAPLFLVYYPVYWLTGMLPTELLAGSVLAVFAIFAMFAAIRGFLLLFRPRANLLLFLLGEAAVVSGSFLYLMQASQDFYYLPLICASGWLAAFAGLACFACLAKTPGRRILLFALDGISFVMLVLSRPNMALLAIAFAAPLFLRILLTRHVPPRQKLESALPFLMPILIGGVAMMYYNYIRFDSPLEFGTSYQLTESDVRYNQVVISLHHFGSMLYHYFLEPFVHTEFFPFFRFTTEKCVDFGNFLYQELSAGLFCMPLNLGVFLSALTLASKEKKDAPKKQICLLLIVGILLLGYLDFLMGGIHIRYVCDLSLALILLSFFLLLGHVHYAPVKSAQILYAIALCLCLATIGQGMLAAFCTEKSDILVRNPDFYLWVAGMFEI